MRTPRPLSAGKLAFVCDPKTLDAPKLGRATDPGPLGQAAALDALAHALQTPHAGFNAYLTGPAGSGRRYIAEFAARRWARQQTAPAPLALPEGATLDTGDGSAPVVYEPRPSYARLVGAVPAEGEADPGPLRLGSLFRAHGGVLVLPARALWAERPAWNALMHALSFGAVAVEGVGRARGVPLSGEIAVGLKVILIGSPSYLAWLGDQDAAFGRNFRVQVDLEQSLPQRRRHQREIVRLLRLRRHAAGGRIPDAGASATLLAEASRLAGDQRRLSLRIGPLLDLCEEAEHFAPRGKALRAADIEAALETRRHRAARVSRLTYERIAKGIVRIGLRDARAGVINGLVVSRIAGHAFGRPMRLSCTTWLGTAGIINIERNVRGSDRSHDKGVMLLTGFLSELFGQDKPINLSASLAFEQAYSGISGDSASAAELCAILSAVADQPIRGDVAMTGAINQLGEVQAVGSVNQKVEGFYEVLAGASALGEGAGVIVPSANRHELQLPARIRDSVQRGEFNVWAVEHVDQAIPLLFGMPAGRPPERVVGRSPSFAPGSLYQRVDARLLEMALALKDFGRGNDKKKEPAKSKKKKA